MSDPYVGEIRMFAGNFAPVNWAFCDGQLLPISGNDALFSLIGTTYGGDGQTTFALPDLRGRIPVHQGTYAGTPFVLGQSGGTEQETLTVNQIPNHTHSIVATSTPASATDPSGNIVAGSGYRPYATPSGSPPSLSSLAANTANAAGGSQPHSNMQPYLSISFIISLYGIFPSQT